MDRRIRSQTFTFRARNSRGILHRTRQLLEWGRARIARAKAWFRITTHRRPVVDPSLPLGKQGEALAAEYLRGLGYQIVAEGERRRWSEIDLIAVDRRTVVFVEVKSRKGALDNALAAVDLAKQKRLTRAALAYLRRHKLLNEPARFDVVGVIWQRWDMPPQIEHIRNAFEATGKWQLYS